MAAPRRLTPDPQNAIEALHEILRLGVQAEESALRGHELLAKGDMKGVRLALADAESCMVERQRLEERWKAPARETVEDPVQPRRRR